ncbi:MAG: GNAT family N-acetyltransferase [Holophaga sp.]
MAEFSILDLGSPLDRQAWLRSWKSDPDREVFAHPEYSARFANPQMKTLCAWFRDSGGEALFPFTLRDLSLEPWGQGLTRCWDLTTPYGYGGPFRVGAPSPEGFWDGFSRWVKEQGVVCGFIRRSLFKERLLPLPEGERQLALNVVRPLRTPLETMWMEYEHKVRKNVNKARRNGLTCRPDPDWDFLPDFLEIYRFTMDRRNAAAFYLFDDAFFDGFKSNLPNNALLFHVHDANGKIVSTELILISTHHIYSFLGGTLPEGFPVGANDLLKHTINEWGHDHGLEDFVIGGGYRPGDGIFLYKKAFAPDGVRPYLVGNLVWDPETYSSLVARRRAWEWSQGREWDPSPTFFPAFRSPAYLPDQA